MNLSEIFIGAPSCCSAQKKNVGLRTIIYFSSNPLIVVE